MNQLSKSLGLAIAALVASACSASNGTDKVIETGGSPAAGQATGGGSATGGSSTTGGGSTTGGSATGGGSNTGGSATGGSSTTGGGSTTGGSATGGGSTTGGSTTGGSETGGGSTTGGTSTGGGSTTGGTATGGSSTTTGGTATGGTATGGTATGGTATGGAGTGGSSACAAATITMVSSSDYQLKVCNLTLDVNPLVGARVTKLTLTPSGSSTPTDILRPYTCSAYNGNDACNSSGITFWTSPQSAWPNASWPPVAAIDGNNYAVTDGGATSGHLVLTGTENSTQGVAVTKDFSADGATGWITATYTMKASKAAQVAPWQIARVPRGGLVFFPSTTTAIKSPSSSCTWTMTQGSSYDWINDQNQTSVSCSDGSKYVADGAAVPGQTYTLLGYALNGNLLLFKFPNVAQGSFAPNEADIEVYPGSGYIELEAQGAYTSLAANGTSAWTIQWRVVPIDSGVTVAANSSSLITFAQQQAAK
jgi:hypothetical protein